MTNPNIGVRKRSVGRCGSGAQGLAEAHEILSCDCSLAFVRKRRNAHDGGGVIVEAWLVLAPSVMALVLHLRARR